MAKNKAAGGYFTGPETTVFVNADGEAWDPRSKKGQEKINKWFEDNRPESGLKITWTFFREDMDIPFLTMPAKDNPPQRWEKVELEERGEKKVFIVTFFESFEIGPMAFDFRFTVDEYDEEKYKDRVRTVQMI